METKTLIIDDDDISIMLTKILLENHSNFQNLDSFLDGTYALEYLKTNYSQDTKYLVFLDINMPLMDGWEFLNEIKHFASDKNTFIYMLSSSTNKLDIEKADNIDMVKGYFSKPLKEEQLGQIEERLTN